jgi:hypothetical protein
MSRNHNGLPARDTYKELLIAVRSLGFLRFRGWFVQIGPRDRRRRKPVASRLSSLPPWWPVQQDPLWYVSWHDRRPRDTAFSGKGDNHRLAPLYLDELLSSGVGDGIGVGTGCLGDASAAPCLPSRQPPALTRMRAFHPRETRRSFIFTGWSVRSREVSPELPEVFRTPVSLN